MSPVDHKERAHSSLGASSASRWMTCPASIPLTERLPDTSSSAAEEGTAAHEICELMLKDITLPDSLNGFDITEEMIEHCSMYVDYINERSEGAEVYIEERVDLSHIDPSMFGTNDAAIYVPYQTIEIIDFKYGKGIAVDAIKNKQLLYYALGVAKDKEVQTVKMTIIQPRADHIKGPIRSWEISYDELLKWEKTLRKSVKEVNGAIEEHGLLGVTPSFYDTWAESGSHCRFCKAAGFCEKLRDESLALAKTSFDEVVESDKVVLPPVESLTEKELGKVLESATALEIWFKQVKAHTHNLLEQGKKVEGYKLVAKRANRKWKDESEVIKEFSDVFGDDLYEKKLLSPSKIEKLVGKEEVSKLTYKPEAGTAVAPLKDKRKEVSPQIEELFTDI